MRLRARILGRERVEAQLRRLIPGIEVAQTEGKAKAAARLAAAIKARSPVRTGELRDSIHNDLLSNRPGVKGAAFGGNTKDKTAQGIFALYIWRFIEFGTRKMSRQPFIFPTYRQLRKSTRATVASSVNRGVRKVLRGG